MKRNAISRTLGLLLSLATVGTIVVPMLPAVAQTEERLALQEETVRGRLDENSNILEVDGSYYNIHTFEGAAGEQIVIELTSDEFDAYLILVDPQGNALAQDDDGGGGTNAKIAIPLPIAGTYQVLVNSYNVGETGEYVLSWRDTTNIEIHQLRADRLFQQGLAQFYASEFAAAISSWERALEMYRDSGDPFGEGQTLGNLGNIYYILGRYPEAISLHTDALNLQQEIGHRQGEARSLGNLGSVYHALGDYDRAVELNELSLAIERELGNRQGESSALRALGKTYDAWGQYERALEVYNLSLELARLAGDRRGEAYSLASLGQVYEGLAQYETSVEFYNFSLEIFQEIDDLHGEAKIVLFLGEVHQFLQEYKSAKEFYRSALEMFRALGDRAGEASALGNLGVTYHTTAEYDRALEAFSLALEIFRSLGDRAREASVVGSMGNTYFFMGNYERAIELQQQSLTISRDLGDRLTEGIALSNLGLSFLLLEDFTSAQANLQMAIVTWESIRENLSDAQKVSIFDRQADSYVWLQEALVGNDRPIEALEIAERGRARAFIDLLAQRISDRTAEALEVLPPSISDIQRIAAERNSTLVEYAIVFDELYIWVISANGDINFRSVAFDEGYSVGDVAAATNFTDRGSGEIAIADLARGTRASIIVERIDDGMEGEMRSLQQGYQTLIAPIADLLPDDPEAKVIFIPHQDLFLVPFAALQDEEGNYLIEKHTTIVAPSIQVLDLTRQNRRPLDGKNAVVVGNPQMPTLPHSSEFLSPLPGAEAEAIAIAELLETEAIIGSNATETDIVSQLNSASIIHLATHGLLEDFGTDVPGAIALTPTETDDGFLTASEIFNMNINAALVVLSACDTGQGNITGDGVIGLSRSLFNSGVPSVVVSLWKVPDAATRDLMVEFYHQLADNPDKARALRNAMLATMQTHPHPVNWAAFTLIGEAE